MATVDWEKLGAPIPREGVELRAGSYTKDKTKAQVLCYLDATCLFDRLDDACGAENWQMTEPVEVVSAGTLAVKVGLSIRVDGEWLTKWGYGYPNRVTADGEVKDDEPLKSCHSDSCKRAGWAWGIGRELRRYPRIWWPVENNRFAPGVEEAFWVAVDGKGAPQAPAPLRQQPPVHTGDAPTGFCPVHKKPFSLVPAGVSSRTGNAYKAFWACPIRGCKEKPKPAPDPSQGVTDDAERWPDEEPEEEA